MAASTSGWSPNPPAGRCGERAAVPTVEAMNTSSKAFRTSAALLAAGGLCWVLKFVVIAASDGALTGAPDMITGVLYFAGIALMALGLAGLGVAALAGRHLVLRVVAAVAGLVLWAVAYTVIEAVAQSIVGDTEPVWLGEEVGIVATGALLMTAGLLLARPRAERERPAPAPAV